MPSKFLARLTQTLRPGGSAPPAEPLLAGRYRLAGELGRGGMGIVYRAQDLVENRAVAVKVLDPDQATPLIRQQFTREAALAAQLQHPHIVAVYAAGAADLGGREPAPYLVMELVAGASLDQLRALTCARIVDLGRQLCEALAYAHGQGIIHRDLKPGNVLVEQRGFTLHAKLADFGLARARGAADLPAESRLAGTVYYLAPEVIAGQPADVRSDLYALGVLLYELLTGRVPFSDFVDDQAILAQHLNEPAAPPSQSRADVPPELEAIVLRLLAKDPAARYASAQEVRAALDQIPEAHAARGNLPPAEAAGRASAEIAAVRQKLETSQLVTVLGEGGAALAVQAGAALAAEFPDGVWHAALDEVETPAAVLPAVAAVLGLAAEPGRPLAVAVAAALREKRLLLVLTGCDRHPAACAQLAETLRRACPEVRLLAAAGRPLGIAGEQTLATA